MAKNQQGRGREVRESVQTSADPASDSSAEQATDGGGDGAESQEARESAAERTPWRRVALCIKSCSVYLGATLVKLHGGDFVKDAQHVKQIERDTEHFVLFPVESPAHMDEVTRAHAARVQELQRLAAVEGYVLHRDGEYSIQKR